MCLSATRGSLWPCSEFANNNATALERLGPNTPAEKRGRLQQKLARRKLEAAAVKAAAAATASAPSAAQPSVDELLASMGLDAGDGAAGGGAAAKASDSNKATKKKKPKKKKKK